MFFLLDFMMKFAHTHNAHFEWTALSIVVIANEFHFTSTF